MASSVEGFPRPYGKYELLRPLGDGGMAEVFLARLPGVAGFEKTLVIKRILPHLAKKRHFVDLFVAEASLAAQVRHRNVVQVYELGQLEDGELFMAMEYVEGEDLRRLLRYAARLGLRLPPWFTLHVVCEILEALTYAYELRDEQGRARRVVHRDVTPSNIFVSDLGEVKLGDFGVAKDETRTQQTRAGQLKGKVSYMAPEQLYSQPIDQRTDIFAVGVVLWESLAQRRLFGGRPDIEVMNAIVQGPRLAPSHVLPDIPPALDALILQALQPQPDHRFEDAETLRRALDEVLTTLRPRVSTSDVRQVQRALRGDIPPEEAGVPRMSTVKGSNPGASAVGMPAFLGLAAGEASSGRSHAPVLANPAFGQAGDSAVDYSVDVPARMPPPRGPSYASLAADLGFQGEASSSSSSAEASALTSHAGLPAAPEDPPPALPLDALVEVPPTPPAVARPSPGVAAAPLGEREIDMDALVAEAVESVRDVAPVSAPIEQDSLIAGLDSRRLVGDTRATRSERWAFVLDREVYEGPHPFWVVDHEGAEIGPCSYEQALSIVRLETKAGFGEQVRAGVRRDALVPGRLMLELLGMETLTRPQRHAECAMIDAEGSSPIALFADYTRQPFSGRLVLFRDRNVRTDYREIEVLAGEPTYVWTEEDSLQYPALLTKKRLVREETMPELAHEALSLRRPLEAVASQRLGSDLTRYTPMLMKERLLELFARGFASYTIEGRDAPRHTEPFAPNLLQVALELTFRCISRDSIDNAVLPIAKERLRPAPDYERVMGQLVLPPDVLPAVQHIGRGKSLSRLVETYPHEQRTLTTLAYFGLEARLLVLG